MASTKPKTLTQSKRRIPAQDKNSAVLNRYRARRVNSSTEDHVEGAGRRRCDDRCELVATRRAGKSRRPVCHEGWRLQEVIRRLQNGVLIGF